MLVRLSVGKLTAARMRGDSYHPALLPPKEIERYLDRKNTNDAEMNKNDKVDNEFIQVFETFHDAPFR
jgi:hypothetical protein